MVAWVARPRVRVNWRRKPHNSPPCLRLQVCQGTRVTVNSLFEPGSGLGASILSPPKLASARTTAVVLVPVTPAVGPGAGTGTRRCGKSKAIELKNQRTECLATYVKQPQNFVIRSSGHFMNGEVKHHTEYRCEEETEKLQIYSGSHGPDGPGERFDEKGKGVSILRLSSPSFTSSSSLYIFLVAPIVTCSKPLSDPTHRLTSHTDTGDRPYWKPVRQKVCPAYIFHLPLLHSSPFHSSSSQRSPLETH